MRDADPVAIDVRPAGEVIPGLKSHMLLHAGPPMIYQHMTDPMRGAAAGAVLFEGWADTLEEATRMLESGKSITANIPGKPNGSLCSRHGYQDH